MGALPAEALDTATGEAAPAQISQQRVSRIFSRIAPAYQRFNHLSSFGMDRSWLRALVQAAPIAKDSRVLDVAGGTGEVAFTICRMKPCASIVLSDITPEMLKVAQERIRRGCNRGVPVQTLLLDAQNMQLPSESFDVLTMAYGIRNMPTRMAALREMHRVLAPGGTACILEFSTPPNPAVRFFHHLYLKWGVPLWGRICTGQREDFEYLVRSILAFPRQQEFCTMLYDAGFSQVSYKNLFFGTVAIHLARK